MLSLTAHTTGSLTLEPLNPIPHVRSKRTRPLLGTSGGGLSPVSECHLEALGDSLDLHTSETAKTFGMICTGMRLLHSYGRRGKKQANSFIRSNSMLPRRTPYAF